MAQSNVTETLIGAVVLAAAVGFFLFASSTVNVSSGGGSYPVVASFRSVEGVNIGTDVRLAGVKIGTVTALDLDLTTYRVDATLHVRDGVAIPSDSAALIASEGLLGGNFVEIEPGGELENLSAGGEIVDTQGAVSLISLLLKFVTAKE
jgi:phospholipid/cholesterol/gamma-HCH transport system substrate-binding protein